MSCYDKKIKNQVFFCQRNFFKLSFLANKAKKAVDTLVSAALIKKKISLMPKEHLKPIHIDFG